MDTRTKIIEPSDLASCGTRLCVAKGWFDVLTAEHCRLLQQAARTDHQLLVLVYRETAARPAPLPACDRAQMIAALACVDLVCVTDSSEADSIAGAVGTAPAFDMDTAQSRDVVRHVIATQAS